MYYAFAPYEQDFRAWWESKAFPDVNPLTRDFLTHLTRDGAPRSTCPMPRSWPDSSGR